MNTSSLELLPTYSAKELDRKIQELEITPTTFPLYEALLTLEYDKFYSILLLLLDKVIIIEDFIKSDAIKLFTRRNHSSDEVNSEIDRWLIENTTSIITTTIKKKLKGSPLDYVGLTNDFQETEIRSFIKSILELPKASDVYIPPQVEVITTDFNKIKITDNEMMKSHISKTHLNTIRKEKQLNYLKTLERDNYDNT